MYVLTHCYKGSEDSACSAVVWRKGWSYEIWEKIKPLVYCGGFRKISKALIMEHTANTGQTKTVIKSGAGSDH